MKIIGEFSNLWKNERNSLFYRKSEQLSKLYSILAAVNKSLLLPANTGSFYLLPPATPKALDNSLSLLPLRLYLPIIEMATRGLSSYVWGQVAANNSLFKPGVKI